MKNNQSLNKKRTREKVILFDIDYTLFDTASFKASNLEKYTVYQEVVDALIALAEHAKLGILSEGELEFQKAKLLETAIDNHFHADYVHIVPEKRDKMDYILRHYHDVNLFFVDDRLVMLADAKKHLPSLYTIWIKRGPYAEAPERVEGFTPDAIVMSLAEILPIIENSK